MYLSETQKLPFMTLIWSKDSGERPLECEWFKVWREILSTRSNEHCKISYLQKSDRLNCPSEITIIYVRDSFNFYICVIYPEKVMLIYELGFWIYQKINFLKICRIYLQRPPPAIVPVGRAFWLFRKALSWKWLTSKIHTVHTVLMNSLLALKIPRKSLAC